MRHEDIPTLKTKIVNMALSRSPGEPVPQVWRRGLGLLPDAQSRSPYILVPDREEALGRRSARRIGGIPGHQCAPAGDRPSVPVTVRLGRHGRGAPDGGGALCGGEPGQGAARRTGGGLALVERAGASCGPRRRTRQRRPIARSLRGTLRRSHRDCAAGKTTLALHLAGAGSAVFRGGPQAYGRNIAAIRSAAENSLAGRIGVTATADA